MLSDDIEDLCSFEACQRATAPYELIDSARGRVYLNMLYSFKRQVHILFKRFVKNKRVSRPISICFVVMMMPLRRGECTRTVRAPATDKTRPIKRNVTCARFTIRNYRRLFIRSETDDFVDWSRHARDVKTKESYWYNTLITNGYNTHNTREMFTRPKKIW